VLLHRAAVLHNFDLRAGHSGFDARFDVIEEFHLPLRVAF
jgi:hypothetical protein